MAQQTISIGTTANDGTGDPLRTAFNKINSNFTELYTSSPFGKQVTITGNQITANASNADLVLSGSGTGGCARSRISRSRLGSSLRHQRWVPSRRSSFHIYGSQKICLG